MPELVRFSLIAHVREALRLEERLGYMNRGATQTPVCLNVIFFVSGAGSAAASSDRNLKEFQFRRGLPCSEILVGSSRLFGRLLI